jgi:hypothetical protein
MKKPILLFLALSFAVAGWTFIKENKPCDNGDTFDGSSRAEAKLSIAPGKAKTITIPKLLATLLSDSLVKARYTLGITSPRIEPEMRNVTIVCWLYTYIREGDEDFHLIIGSTPDTSNVRFFSAEISALPKDTTAKDYARLKKARNQFISEIIKDGNDCPKDYISGLYANPVKVKITGSLFFDLQHSGKAGRSGTGFYKSESPWEIHPVTAIKVVK